jgi:hypothetical protein
MELLELLRSLSGQTMPSHLPTLNFLANNKHDTAVTDKKQG